MLMEVKARLSCRYSLEQELENLKSRFVMNIFEVLTPPPSDPSPSPFSTNPPDANIDPKLSRSRLCKPYVHDEHALTVDGEKQEPGAVLIEFSPAVGKNASRWRCEVQKAPFLTAYFPLNHCAWSREYLLNDAVWQLSFCDAA